MVLYRHPCQADSGPTRVRLGSDPPSSIRVVRQSLSLSKTVCVLHKRWCVSDSLLCVLGGGGSPSLMERRPPPERATAVLEASQTLSQSPESLNEPDSSPPSDPAQLQRSWKVESGSRANAFSFIAGGGGTSCE